jgi:hypothetical protein
MRPHLVMASVGLMIALSATSRAQPYKIEPLKQAPPASIAPAVRDALRTEGYKVLDDKGKTYAEIWLRKAVPASEKPSGPSGAVQFPFLAEGELLGALRFEGEGHDYRDQTIPKGVYTLRYGLQPVNGDHLGVSTFRDYALLVPAAKDQALANIPTKPLNEKSAESAGTSHPAVLILLTPPATAAAPPSIVRDEEKDLWGAVVPLNLDVKGGATVAPLNLELILIGAAMA